MAGHISVQGQKASLNGRARESGGPSLAFCCEGHPNPSVPLYTSVQMPRPFGQLPSQSLGLSVMAAHTCH